MIMLYHGTTGGAADLARNVGLKPRLEGAGNWLEKPSRSDCIYLTAVYGGMYAMHILCNSGGKNTDEMAVIEVDTDLLDKTLLLPDEDFVEQLDTMLLALRRQPTLLPETKAEAHRRRLTDIRDRLEAYAGKDWIEVEEWKGMAGWEASVAGLGTCAYKGIIPPQAISRIAYFNVVQGRPHPILRFFLEADPTIPHFQANKQRLGICNRWLFGSCSEDDWRDEPDRAAYARREGFRVWSR